MNTTTKKISVKKLSGKALFDYRIALMKEDPIKITYHSRNPFSITPRKKQSV
ncbi:MAG: hypothetical protein LBU91_00525 [Bacteroidales bacterium]|jgi:hypothetical protein|nr:hypothetical protein [Bacteroidales bacterium]